MATQPLAGSSLDPSHPLWPRVLPKPRNCNASADAARLLYYCGDDLVVVLPSEKDKPGSEATVYGVTSTGMLSWHEAENLIDAAADRYFDDCEQMLGQNRREFGQCSRHAAKMKDANVPSAIRKKMVAVIRSLKREGPLPPGVVEVPRSKIDADLTCIGTPKGVLDLRTGRMLPYDEARKRLVAGNTGVEYDANARHPRVDEILPPIGPAMASNLAQWYRAATVGYMLTHAPAREFMWEICATESGKTTFVNALKAGLGDDYITVIRPEAFRSDPRRTASSHNGDLRRLAKPTRLAFVSEFSGEIDSSIIKGASGGDDIAIRQIYLGDEIINVVAHVWFMGNPKDEGGPQLGITNDDENTRAILRRVKMLTRDPIPEPDESVVNEDSLEFRKAALARIVEYTMACSVLSKFPPDLPSNRELQEQQRRTEMADWQVDWLPNVIRERSEGDGYLPDACVKAVYQDFKQWWRQHRGGNPLSQTAVTRKVNRHYGRAVDKRCPVHGGVGEGVYPNFVIVPQPVAPPPAWPVGLLPV